GFMAEMISHEMGHVLLHDVLYRPENEPSLRELKKRHQTFLDKTADLTVEQYIHRLRPYHEAMGTTFAQAYQHLTMDELSLEAPDLYRYLTSFDEWVAEQTARWAPTTDNPQVRTPVEKFFAEIAERLRELFDFIRSRYAPD